MPKYFLITPKGKRALAPERNSYQTTWKIQKFDFLTDLSSVQGRKMKKAHFTILSFAGGGGRESVHVQTTSLSWTIPQEREGWQHQFPGEPLGSKLPLLPRALCHLITWQRIRFRQHNGIYCCGLKDCFIS